MAAELRAAGLDVTEGVGGTGVVGMLKNGEGPLLLLRADMDGLPVPEKSGLDYASTATQVGLDGKEYPVMHACGHDVHITSMVGTARALAELKDSWSGTLMFVVQPAEERVGGAKAMMEDGLYDRFGTPDYALAFHVTSVLPTGKISASEGIQYSSADSVDIMVPGIGAHGASPHMGRDPVYIASQIVTAMQSIVSREVGPLSPAVITVGAFQSGLKHNIISDRADLQLTVRANDEATRAQLLAAIERVAVNTGKAHGLPDDLPVKVKVSEGTPVTKNDSALARRLNGVMQRELGSRRVRPVRAEGDGRGRLRLFRRGGLQRAGLLLRRRRHPARGIRSGSQWRPCGTKPPQPPVQDRPARKRDAGHTGDDRRGAGSGSGGITPHRNKERPRTRVGFAASFASWLKPGPTPRQANPAAFRRQSPSSPSAASRRRGPRSGGCVRG